MKFSRLSTIQFTDNDFQQKTPLEMPFIPRGETFTIMELEEGFDISLSTAIPSMPAAIDIVNVRTGKRTTISDNSSAPCTFTGTIPASIRPGVYRAEFLVRNTQSAVSKPFRITADNQWGCIVGNSPSAKYSDGTPSIVGGRLVRFYQYFRRRDFRLAAVENNTFYDDDRGTSFSLQNKNYTNYHLEGYAGERTTAAISMLLAGSWTLLKYKDGSGNNVLYRIHKRGDLSTEPIGRGFCQFSVDFNGRRQNYIAISYIDIQEWGVNFDSNDNMLIQRTDHPVQRVPTSIFCLPFTNVDIETKRGTLFTVDTSASYQSVTFTFCKIPHNFGRACKNFDVAAIRQSDKITEIGDNVNLSCKGTTIRANFPNIHRIGRNVKLGEITGIYQFSENTIIDNLTIPSGTLIFCKNGIFKNCKLEYSIAGTIAELHNVTINAPSFFGPNPIINRDALLVDCKFEYIADTYTLYAQRLIGCRMIGAYNATTKFDLRNFAGSLENTFTYQKLKVDTDAATSTFRIDATSLHGYVQDDGDYLASVQRIDGRKITDAGIVALRWSKVNGNAATNYAAGEILTNDGSLVTRGNITTASIGDNTPADILSDVTLVGSQTITVKGDLGWANLNNVSGSTSTVIVQASMLLGWLQSGGSYLNGVDFTLQVNNDLPAGFSYLLIKTNPSVLQNLSLTVNVSNDPNGYLTDRLRELYPTFSINSI